MEVQNAIFDEIIEFKGRWDVVSKCGLKIIEQGDKTIAIATELYKDNPGTAVTECSASLAMQVCEAYDIAPEKLEFIEHSPNMNSKLGFYSEEFYKVDFEWVGDKFDAPKWKQLEEQEVKALFDK